MNFSVKKMNNIKILVKYAPPADAALIDEIRAGFCGIYGRMIDFSAVEDKSLLGGFVAYADGKLYDMSLKTQLDTLVGSLHGTGEVADE